MSEDESKVIGGDTQPTPMEEAAASEKPAVDRFVQYNMAKKEAYVEIITTINKYMSEFNLSPVDIAGMLNWVVLDLHMSAVQDAHEKQQSRIIRP